MTVLAERPLFAPLPPWPFGALAPHGYNLIVADPPWAFEAYSEAGHEKGAAAHYACLSVEEIAARFPLGELAEPDCLLLLWCTGPLLPRQLACIPAWGFVYASFFPWRKVTVNGKRAVGPGYRVRGECEYVALGVRGAPRHDPFPGIFDGVRREHSRKPEEFYALVDRYCPGLTRRADVFARTRRPGWDAFGDELDRFAGDAP